MKKLRLKNTDFTLFMGNAGWFINPLDKKYSHLVLTQDGVYLNGKLIAEGKLKLIEGFNNGS
jgi:hypothetical protein